MTGIEASRGRGEIEEECEIDSQNVSRGHISTKKQRIERAQPREKRARDYIKNHKLREGAAPVAKQTNQFQGGGKLRRSENKGKNVLRGPVSGF